VDGAHAGGGVDEDRQVLGISEGAAPEGLHGREDEQAQKQDLEQEQEISTEPLERRIDALIADDLPPQGERGELQAGPLELEEVEDDQRDEEREQRGRERGRESRNPVQEPARHGEDSGVRIQEQQFRPGRRLAVASYAVSMARVGIRFSVS